VRRGIPEFHELRRRVENIEAPVVLVPRGGAAGVRRAWKARRGKLHWSGQRAIELDKRLVERAPTLFQDIVFGPC